MQLKYLGDLVGPHYNIDSIPQEFMDAQKKKKKRRTWSTFMKQSIIFLLLIGE